LLQRGLFAALGQHSGQVLAHIVERHIGCQEG
jgi:hypothetical protein